jgi:hypothetical protein
MKRWVLTPAVALAMAALVHAAPQIEAEPNKDYPITPQTGAWVIVCARYTGPDAADLARQLVYWLRSKHNQPAYVLNYGDKKRAEMNAVEDAWKQQHPGVPFKHWKIDDEFAVFIGGFADMESARDYMVKVVKKLPLPELKLADGKPAHDQILQQVEGPNGKLQVKPIPLNPLASSFVSRNPTMSASEKKADPFLKVLNAGEDYSLLNCKELWTIAVQEYRGDSVVVNQLQDHSATTSGSFLDKLKPWGNDKHQGDALNAAAMQAHETASFLRKLKFDAYVLHMRTGSIVTIGGFQGPTDPAMKRTAEQLASIRGLDVLKLFAKPMEIPRP